MGGARSQATSTRPATIRLMFLKLHTMKTDRGSAISGVTAFPSGRGRDDKAQLPSVAADADSRKMPELPGESRPVCGPQLSCRCAILCLERALESGMDSMNGQHGKQASRAIRRDSQAGMLSVLLSILASKRVVLDRQHGRNRLHSSLGSSMDSAK